MIGRRSYALALALVVSIPTLTPSAAAQWRSLRSEHLQVVGNASPGELREVALRLEQFRDVVATLNQATLRGIEGVSVVVLVFRDGRSYEPFMPMVDGRRTPVSGMFIDSGPTGVYITLNLDAGREAYPAIYHEYSHFLLRGVFARAPLWFSEGLAEYYSTLDITNNGRRALIGAPTERHVTLLRERRLPLAQLLSANASSPVYTQDTPDRAVLYAQSWAVVHHALHGEPRRRSQLVDLAQRLAAGASPEQAVRDAYGMNITELDREVQAYMRREIYQATSFELKDAVVTSVSADVTTPDDAEVEAWLGGVQAGIGRLDGAAVRLERALDARPDLGGAHAALANVRMRQGRAADARAHMDAARKLNALPQPLTYQVQAGGQEAVHLAGRLLLKAGNYAGLRDVFTPIVRSNPRDHESALILAEALLLLGDLDGARALLGPVLANATEAQRAQARTLLSRLARLQLQGGDTPAADDRTK